MQKLTTTLQDKLELMIANPVEHPAVCWPRSLARDPSGNVVGYLMPAARGKELQRAVFVKPLLVASFPSWTRVELVELTLSVLEPLRVLHDRNVILGDINPLNILVAKMRSPATRRACAASWSTSSGPVLMKRRAVSRSRELASTLLFVAVNRGQSLAGHVGDGVIGCERAGVLEVLSHPEHGEFLNETTFVTSSRAAERLALHRGALDGRSAFVLMSDGSAESLYRRRDRSLAPGVASICTWLDRRAPDEVELALQRSLGDVIGPQTRDDCSLAILREVVTPSSRLAEFGVPFQRAFLDCTNARALGKRVAIASLMGTPMASPTEIARQVGVAPATARRHLSALRSILAVRPYADAPRS